MKDIVNPSSETASQRTRGRTLGVAWAASRAWAGQLERLESFQEGEFSPGECWDDWLRDEGMPDDAFGRDHYLARSIVGDVDDFRRNDSDRFWSDEVGATGEERTSGEFLVGFVDGAMSVFKEVEEQI